MANGDLHALGTLYVNGTKQLTPTRPWQTGVEVATGSGTGNLIVYTAGASIEIRDTDPNSTYKLLWREVNFNGKKLLISDRVLIDTIAWADLNGQSLVSGKTVVIDGKYYKLRLLDGGTSADRGDGAYSYNGGLPAENEWEQIIVNRANIQGLPIPSDEDKNLTTSEADRSGAHNQFWNWYKVQTITKNLTSASKVITRGNASVTHFYYSQATTTKYTAVGWRPVLEEIAPPTGKIKDQAPGTVINFAGSSWTILEPITGFLYKNDSVLQRNFDADNYKYFVPARVTGLAYWLNNGYLDTFSPQDKAAIKTKEWGTGGASNENATLVSAKVGLLSLSEQNQYITQLKILSPPTSEMWMRTYHGDASKVYTVLPSGGAYLAHATNDKKAVHPVLFIDPNTNIANGIVVYNAVPTIILNTSNNATLYENDTLNITGTASDADAGNSVTVRYQINANTVRAIKAFISDGTTLEAFSKSLTFRGGSLYDGDTLIVSGLVDGVAHTLKVWATDDQGGTSANVERTFYVVPNRAPSLTVNPPVTTGIIDNDEIEITGSYNDLDNNTSIVSYRINGGASVQVASGTSGNFDFKIKLGLLKVGLNSIVVEVIDSYGAKTSRTVKLQKNEVKTEQLKSTARYKVLPPHGTATGVVIWVRRDENLTLSASISMTQTGESESFVSMTKSVTAPIANTPGIVEDQFQYENETPADNIILQLDLERSSLTADEKIHVLIGVID